MSIKLNNYLIRFSDIILSVFGIAVLLPVLFLVSFYILVIDGYPVLFLQKRIGVNQSEFMILKFRTLKKNTVKDYKNKETLIYYFGSKFLRRSSLDELPQLFNILLGNMSFVGPRPLLKIQLAAMSDRVAKRRHTIKPGLTGFAQVYGRRGLSWFTQLSYDLKWIDRASFVLYVQVIFLTIKTTLTSVGIEPKESTKSWREYL